MSLYHRCYDYIEYDDANVKDGYMDEGLVGYGMNSFPEVNNSVYILIGLMAILVCCVLSFGIGTFCSFVITRVVSQKRRNENNRELDDERI